MTSPTLKMRSPCCAANFSRSGMRAIVPSSFITSQMPPAGMSPATRARSPPAPARPAASLPWLLPSPRAPLRKEARDVLAQDVRFHVHAVARPFHAPGRGAQRLGDEQERDGLGPDHLVDGQADAVER